jgi:hypothetical protein
MNYRYRNEKMLDKIKYKNLYILLLNKINLFEIKFFFLNQKDKM